jgi:hypothetical protein
VRDDDSVLSKKLFKARTELLKLMRETVNFDRVSRNISHSGKQTWTNAAQNRDHSLHLLRMKLEQIAKDI